MKIRLLHMVIKLSLIAGHNDWEQNIQALITFLFLFRTNYELVLLTIHVLILSKYMLCYLLHFRRSSLTLSLLTILSYFGMICQAVAPFSSIASSNLFRLFRSISDKRISLFRLYSFKGARSLSGERGRGESCNSWKNKRYQQ